MYLTMVHNLSHMNSDFLIKCIDYHPVLNWLAKRCSQDTVLNFHEEYAAMISIEHKLANIEARAL